MGDYRQSDRPIKSVFANYDIFEEGVSHFRVIVNVNILNNLGTDSKSFTTMAAAQAFVDDEENLEPLIHRALKQAMSTIASNESEVGL